jgi:Asp/Glu/hydantoin racemase
MATRIWHQSMTDLDRLPGYKAMLGEHARRVGGSDFEVDLHGVRPETYAPGMAPVAMTRYRWAHHLVFTQFVENAVRAETEGYDAVAISCFVDPALDLARSAVDIPVVSSCETALLVAATIGTSFGLVTIDRSMVRILHGLVAQYGFADRVRAITTLDPPMDEFELDEAFVGRGPLLERFTTEARRLIERHDIDVLIPAEGVLNTMLVRNGLREIDGVPVLDSYGALLQFADMRVRLRRSTGLETSRRTAYAKAPAEMMQHLRRLTCSVLEAGASAPGTAQS